MGSKHVSVNYCTNMSSWCKWLVGAADVKPQSVTRNSNFLVKERTTGKF